MILLFSLIITDTPDDGGGSITIKIEPLPPGVQEVRIYREGEFVHSLVPPSCEYQDQGLENGKEYHYRVEYVFEDTVVVEEGSAVPVAQWFNKKRVNVLILMLIFSAFILTMIRLARTQELFIRKIPALDAIDEAVGRATEMGKPILYVPGIGDITMPETLASLAILGRVAKKTAEYGADILVPNWDAVVMTAAQEVVKQSYTEAGRPDLYKERNIMYLTSEQFGFAAGVDGIMMREKPGAIFLQGTFFAESLILAETGFSIGAIQIAGTVQTAQLPFFVAACDYTLIGEELYAASSYITRDPVMLGTIKGSDWSKVLIMSIIGICAILGTLAHFMPGLEGVYQNLINWFSPK